MGPCWENGVLWRDSICGQVKCGQMNLFCFLFVPLLILPVIFSEALCKGLGPTVPIPIFDEKGLKVSRVSQADISVIESVYESIAPIPPQSLAH